MANRSDREQGQPSECPRRHRLISRMGTCSRTPSGQQSQLTASTGRTEDGTRPMPLINLALATREPSTEGRKLRGINPPAAGPKDVDVWRKACVEADQ